MDKYQTLREKDNPTNNVYPNIKTQNIPDSAVTNTKIADGAVTTDKIADANVTSDKIADANVTSDKIADANVTSDKLANGAVTTDKIADANVTNAKLSDNSISTGKIINGSVTTAKLADGINRVQHRLADTNFTTIAELLTWVEEQILNGRKPVYYDGYSYSTIDCVSTDQQVVMIKCSLPQQALNATETISTDADVVAMYNTPVADCLMFIGV